MHKDQSNLLKEHLNNVLTKNFHPTEEYNKKFYSKIPHIFFKYRECNENNFDALENEYLWLVTADEFKNDLFDSTIYYDLSKQKSKIKRIMKDRFPEVIIEAIRKELAKKVY